ncbi:MAG: hypothetical protein KDK97_03850 [Verrucomicrobiales bacterium]|nr:hypothetical protein [Verrucomicrobiales bacterium]MCP5557849.1 hypothetical protein [Verrucomicrobiaceae bacterium]
MSKGRIQLPDGAVPVLGHVKHRDGWTYIMALRILREPGAPRPPAPKGALFSVEKEIVVPDRAFVRVQLQKSAKDGSKTAFGNSLVFKPANTAKGFILRWHAYAPPLPNAAPTYLLDFVDPDSGAIFHRIEDGFPPGVVLSSPNSQPLPDVNKSIMIAAPGTKTILRLLRASQKVTPGAALTAWWDVYAEVTHVSPITKSVPQFQLPER